MNPFPSSDELKDLIQLAKREDLGPQNDDVTSRLLIDENALGVGTLLQKSVGITCGLPIVEMICRAYDEGIAFRYYFPENPTGVYYHITEENTEFALPPGTRGWCTSWAQGPYRLLPLKDWPDESERPLTLQLPEGGYVCLAEAQMVDYARTKFKLSRNKPNTIMTSLFGAVDGITYFGSPWRVVFVGEQAADIIRNESLLLNLNPPAAIAQTDWIKPGWSSSVASCTSAATGRPSCSISATARRPSGSGSS